MTTQLQLASGAPNTSGFTHPSRPRIEMSIQEASKLLGRNHVITAAQTAAIWGIPSSEGDQFVDETAVRIAAERNAAGQTDFRLAYSPGLSLLELNNVPIRGLRSVINSDQDYGWWLVESQRSWTAMKPPPGYLLMDVSLRYRAQNWHEQRISLLRSGGVLARTLEADVAAACVGFYIANGGERLLPEEYHWGPSTERRGDLVCVGSFDHDGVKFTRLRPGLCDNALGVVASIRL